MGSRLFVDMDGTIANFQDNILDEDGSFQIELMYKPGFFRALKPFNNIIEGIRLIINENPNIEVFIISAAEPGEPPYFVRQKNRWLDEYFPEINQEHRIFPYPNENKANYIPNGITNNDYILDDYNVNLQEFESSGGNSIKCLNHVNGKGIGAFGGDVGNCWEGAFIRYDDAPAKIASTLELYFEDNPNLNESYTRKNQEEMPNISRDFEDWDIEL